MSEGVPVTLDVGGRTLKATATRTGRVWRLVAAAFPEHVSADMDLERAKRQLVRVLLPECARVEAARRRSLLAAR